MTTIAWDGSTMSCDSLQVGNYIDRIDADKIYELGDGLLGIAGDLAKGLEFLTWMRDGSDPDTFHKLGLDSKSTMEALVCSSEGCFYYSESYIGVPVGFPAAIGSGSGFAMGAMMHCADSRKAVEIACKLDPRSGGEIITHELEDQYRD